MQSNNRAVYYARVSTDEEKQINALGKQCDEMVRCIKRSSSRKIALCVM